MVVLWFAARAQEAGGAGNLLTTSLKGMTSGERYVVKASISFSNTSWCCNRFISISCCVVVVHSNL
jgi:hypothetical protein